MLHDQNFITLIREVYHTNALPHYFIMFMSQISKLLVDLTEGIIDQRLHYIGNKYVADFSSLLQNKLKTYKILISTYD